MDDSVLRRRDVVDWRMVMTMKWTGFLRGTGVGAVLCALALSTGGCLLSRGAAGGGAGGGTESKTGTILLEARNRVLVAESTHGPGSPLLVPALRALAMERMKLGRYEEAAMDIRRALKIMETSKPVDADTVVGLLLDMARISGAGGDRAEAAEWLDLAERTGEARFGARSVAMARVLSEQGNFLAAGGDLEGAERKHRASMEILDQARAVDVTASTEQWLRLADLLDVKGKSVESLELLQKALVVRQNEYGSRSRSVAEVMRRMSGVYRGMRRLADAESMAREALSIDEKAGGTYDEGTAADLSALGCALRLRGDAAQAETCLTMALGIHTQLFGALHPLATADLMELALICEAQQRFPESLRFLREAQNAVTVTRGTNDQMVAHLVAETARVSELAEASTRLAPTTDSTGASDLAVRDAAGVRGDTWRTFAEGDFNGDGVNDLAEVRDAPDGEPQVMVTIRRQRSDAVGESSGDLVQTLRSGDDGRIRGVAAAGGELKVVVGYTNRADRVMRIRYKGGAVGK